MSNGLVGRVRIRSSRWLLRFAAVALLAPLQLRLAWTDPPPRELFDWGIPTNPSAGLALAIALAALAVWLVRLGYRGRPGTIRVTDRGLEVDSRGRLGVFARRQIRNAWTLPESATLQVELDSGDLVYGPLRSAAEADDMVEALGFGPSSRAVTIPSGRLGTEIYMHVAFGVLGPMLALVLGSMVSGVLGLIESYARIMPATSLLTIALLARWAAEPRMRIGVDGIATRGPFGATFIPLDATSTVSRAGDRLTVTSAGRAFTAHFVDDALASAAEHRLERVLALRHEAPEGSAALAKLERGSSRVGEWRKRITALGPREAYRAMQLTHEELELVLASAASSPEHRVAAALALRDRDPENVERTLRAAAAASARPEVRVALSRLADDRIDDDALEEALAEPAPPKRMRGWTTEPK